MAGDEYYIFLCDHKKKNIEEKYLGKLRYYNTKFSLKNYQYEGNNNFYEIEERMSDGESRYSVWTLYIIEKIRKSLLDEPLSAAEKEAYEDLKDTIDWIDNMLKKYSEQYFYSSDLVPGSIHILFYTDID